MDNIDLTQISLPLSLENFQKLLRAEQMDKTALKDLPKDLKDDYNRCYREKLRQDRQEMLRTGEFGQDD